MNNSEKLFKAINNIDEKLIDEAKDEEQKPVQIKTKKRLPIKETALFAACFAVLAGVVFGIVKYRIDHDIQTAEKNSNSLSDLSGSSDISNSVPKPELTFTDEDRELQAILKDLTAKCGEIDRMFYQMSVIDGEPDLKTEWGDYYIIPEGLRTEPGGLFAVPRSVGEMEELIHKVFSSDAAEFYLQSDNVCKGRFTEDSVGNVLFEPDDIHAGANPTFIEVDGKMYRSSLEWDDYSSSYSRLGIDCDTAKVTRRSDKAMEFSYRGYDYPNRFDGGDVYAERNGAVVYEDGAWKLHYFYRQGFIPEMPVEYTEQDLELHAILDALEPGNDVRALFSLNSATAEGTEYKFILPGNYEPEGSYQYYIDVSGPQTITNHPKSLSELEDMLLKYFTREAADNYMSRTCKGTMTENDDGTYSVTLDKDVFDPVYIEIDGKMFYHTSAASGYAEFLNTAKVADWTDDMIICTYVCAAPGGYSTETGTLRYERGGWKWDKTGNNTDSEAEDTVNDILPAGLELFNLFSGIRSSGDKYEFQNARRNNNTATFCLAADGMRTSPNGMFAIPKSRPELEALLKKYFSERAAKSYMDNIGTGSMTKNPDGTYTVATDKDYLSPIIEIDGQLFFRQVYGEIAWILDPTTAKPIEHTDKYIRFEFTDSFGGNNSCGGLVNENGGWKLNLFYGFGFGDDVPYPLEFTDEDLELQAILEELSPGHDIAKWNEASTVSENEPEYEFIFPASFKQEARSAIYRPMPEGTTPDGKIEYPHTAEALRALYMRYFTQDSVDRYMEEVGKGTMTKNPDGTYSVKVDGNEPKNYLEIDGKLYVTETTPYLGAAAYPLFDSAKVIEKTNDTIKFSIIQSAKYHIGTGIIKYERGGWRLRCDGYSFVVD